jgi:alpha-beta hydrolase superfamily lysophospholipase
MKQAWMVLLMLGWPSIGSAQTGAFGAPIGRLPVGYRVEWSTDRTRSWPLADASGRLRPIPRVVRVHLWYPAVAGSGEAMKFRDYMEPPTAPGVPRPLADAIRANDLGTPGYSFRGIYRDDSAAFERAMNTGVVARNRAAPAPGRHPVVVYSVGQNDFSQDAVLLAEWLASNGYIVVSVPHLGTGPRRTLLFVHDPLSYETQLRDLEVALANALELKGADEQRILAVGHSYGGIYALLLAMRGNSVHGVIGLDPTYVAQRAGYEYDLRRFPFFDPDLRIPIVTLRRGSGSVNRDLVNSLLRAERLEIVYPDLMHGDFATVPFLRRDLPVVLQLEEETRVRSPQAAAAGAAAVFRQVLAAAEAILSGRRLEGAVLQTGGVKQETAYTAASPAPTAEELYWAYRSGGLQAAEAAVTAARAEAGNQEVFSESRTLTIARELGYSGKDRESLDMFRLLAFTFPDSSSAQLEAAEALLEAGLKTEARPLLMRALQLDPTSESAKASLAKTEN